MNEAPLSFEASAFQCFVRGIRGVWRDQAYRGAVEAAKQSGSDDPAEIERQARRSAAYSLYAWLERHSQQLKYYGRWGIMRWMEANRERLAGILEAAARRHPERLVLDLEGVDSNPAVESLPAKISPDDPYVSGIRIGRFKPGTVRLVLDLKTQAKPQTFVLQPIGEYG